jgi:putative oxidoreductase
MSREQVVRVAKIAAAWIPALLLITIFVPQGWAKFSDTSGWAIAFRHWGYAPWFRVLVGTIELLASACLLWSRTAAIGALLIVCVMLGAIGTHIVFDHGRHITSEILPLSLALIVLVTRHVRLR